MHDRKDKTYAKQRISVIASDSEAISRRGEGDRFFIVRGAIASGLKTISAGVENTLKTC